MGRHGWVAIVLAVVSQGCSVPNTEAPSQAAAVAHQEVSTSLVVASTILAPLDQSTTSSTEYGRDPIVLGFAGDTNFVGWQTGHDPLSEVGVLLSEPDLMVVNLETTVADAEVGTPPVDKRYLFKSPPESLSVLTRAGVDVVALGNNHTLDFGAEALAQTLDELYAYSLLWVGAGLNQAEAYEPLVVEVGEWTIGLVSLSRVPCDWSAGGHNARPQVAWACPPFLELADAAVIEAQNRAEYVVVMVHGGTEGDLCPSDFMVDLRHHFSELGVDLMVDGHPHVVQGISSYGDMLVVNSTGNFAFPAAHSISANSAIFNLELSEDGVSLRVQAVRAPGGVASPASDAQRQEIFEQISNYSDGWRIDPDGRAVASPDQVSGC